MKDCADGPNLALITYLAEMTAQLADLARDCRCANLAYLLDVAALEARSSAQMAVQGSGPPTANDKSSQYH
jgi:hypothetical protein